MNPEAKEDRPLLRNEEKRYCCCGTRLSAYNLHDQCARCFSKTAMADVPRENGELVVWKRKFSFPIPQESAPPVQGETPTIDELEALVAWACSVIPDRLRKPTRKDLPREQVARLIFIHLVYRDIYRGTNQVGVIRALGRSRSTVADANRKIAAAADVRVLTALERIRAHYQPAIAQAA